MDFDSIIYKIERFIIDASMDEFHALEFFDDIGEKLYHLNTLTHSQKRRLIQAFFIYLKNQSPEMDEDFSFIHLIESIDKPEYIIYFEELFLFCSKNATITSTLLLNRHINSATGAELEKGMQFLKSIADNDQYSSVIREHAQDYYEVQLEK